MTSLPSLLQTIPRGRRILLFRLLAFLLSTISLALFATTISIYKTRIAPSAGFVNQDDDLLTVNSLPIGPLCFSILWCGTILTLLARRLIHTHRYRIMDASTMSGGLGRQPPVINPWWEFFVDCHIGTWLVVQAVLAAIEAGKWRSGDVYQGASASRTKVDLRACPVTNPDSGRTEYYCTSGWNMLVQVQIVAINLMAISALSHVTIFLRAGYDVHTSRKYRHAEVLQRKIPSANAHEDGPPPTYSNETAGVELQPARTGTS